MKYIRQRIDNTDTHRFEAGHENGIFTLVRSYDGKKPVQKFDHNWWKQRGLLIAASQNATYFGGNAIVGGMIVDGGFLVSKFIQDKKFVTAIYQNDTLKIDECDDPEVLKERYKGYSWIVQLSGDWYIQNNEKVRGDGTFDHTFGKHPRSFIGQKADGTIVMFSTDGRGGNDSGYTTERLMELANEMGCVTAVGCDGGGSSTLALNLTGEAEEPTMVNTNENRPVPTAFLFMAQVIDIEVIDMDAIEDPEEDSIGIDMGHGMLTSGKRTPDGIREAQQNYPIGFMVADKIKGFCKPVLTNVNMVVDRSLADRVYILNASRPNYTISVHKDAYGTNWNNANGFSILVYDHSSKSMTLAREIEKELKALGIKSRGIIERPDLYINRKTNHPSLFVELGFMTNKEESKQMWSGEWFEKYSTAIATAIETVMK